MRLGTFPIEQEGSVGVESLLQAVQLRFRAVPDLGLSHNEHGFVRFGVVPDQINHAHARITL